MTNFRFSHLGWILFSALLAVVFAGGFQAPTEKVGVVDISKVVEGSNYGKANQETFKKMKSAREALLEFIDNNRVLTVEQATSIRDLALKMDRQKPEDAKLDSLKADVIAQTKKWQELATKPNLTSEERTLVEEYAKRAQTTADLSQRLFRDFTNDMQEWADKQKLASVSKARDAIQTVAKAQGYNVVFEIGVAPYGANDLTDAALDAMNAQK